MKFIEYLVLGTGFGAGTVGLRLAQSGKQVVFLERGRRWSGKNQPATAIADGAHAFPELGDANFLWARKWSNPTRHRLGLYEMKQFPTIQGLVAAGVGGGSLIWANVVVKAHEEAFSKGWPAKVNLNSLEKYYGYARPFLRPKITPELDSPLQGAALQLPRARLLRDAAIKLNARWQPVEVAVNFSDSTTSQQNGFGSASQMGCNMCGLCTSGCPQGAKNSVDLTYIAAAEALGAEVRIHHEALLIQPVAGGYKVYLRVFDENGKATRSELYARQLVIACGTFGSTQLLLRSRAAGYLPELSKAVGSRFSINGNVLGGALNPDADGLSVRTNEGPSVSSMIDFDKIVVEDISNPLWAAGLIGGSQLGKITTFLQAYFGIKAKPEQLSRLALDLLVYVGVGMDRAEGRLHLGPFGNISASWPSIKSDPAIRAQYRAQASIAQILGRQYVPDVFSTFGRAFTYHPLGGCPMGADASSGVVDEHGAVFNYPGLYVADGSIIPTALGRNPSFTICALAERIAERMNAA